MRFIIRISMLWMCAIFSAHAAATVSTISGSQTDGYGDYVLIELTDGSDSLSVILRKITGGTFLMGSTERILDYKDIDGDGDLIEEAHYAYKAQYPSASVPYIDDGDADDDGNTVELLGLEEEGRSAEREQQQKLTVGDFYMLETEVTQGLWKMVMGANPSLNVNIKSELITDGVVKITNLPVENVSKDEMDTFCTTLNGVINDGLTVMGEPTLSADATRLPSEAEWEYTCRSSNTNPAVQLGKILTSGATPEVPEVTLYMSQYDTIEEQAKAAIGLTPEDPLPGPELGALTKAVKKGLAAAYADLDTPTSLDKLYDNDTGVGGGGLDTIGVVSMGDTDGDGVVDFQVTVTTSETALGLRGWHRQNAKESTEESSIEWIRDDLTGSWRFLYYDTDGDGIISKSDADRNAFRDHVFLDWKGPAPRRDADIGGWFTSVDAHEDAPTLFNQKSVIEVLGAGYRMYAAFGVPWNEDAVRLNLKTIFANEPVAGALYSDYEYKHTLNDVRNFKWSVYNTTGTPKRINKTVKVTPGYEGILYARLKHSSMEKTVSELLAYNDYDPIASANQKQYVAASGDISYIAVQSGWWKQVSVSSTIKSCHRPVKGKLANAWGLFDMHGNVWEACRDRFNSLYEEGTTWVSGDKVPLRGGSWDSLVYACRAANRSDWDGDANVRVGFRFVIEGVLP